MPTKKLVEVISGGRSLHPAHLHGSEAFKEHFEDQPYLKCRHREKERE